MNNALSAAGQCRALIPTVYREDYVAAEHLTDAGDAAPLVLVDTNGNIVGDMRRVAQPPEGGVDMPIFRAVIPADGNAAQRLRDIAAGLRASAAEPQHAAARPIDLPPEGGRNDEGEPR